MLDSPLSSNAIDFYYRMCTVFILKFKKIRFTASALKQINFLTEIKLHRLTPCMEPLNMAADLKYDVFPALILFGFCITVYYPV